MTSAKSLPVVGITMGDPAGIGPEILMRAAADHRLYKTCRPVLIGDRAVLETAMALLDVRIRLHAVDTLVDATFVAKEPDLLAISRLPEHAVAPARPTAQTGLAMLSYVEAGVDLALAGAIDALVTGPITKTAMKMAGSPFHGHTELIAKRTGTTEYAMMLAGDRLKVVLATIHIPLASVPSCLNTDGILKTTAMAHQALQQRFGIKHPRLAVAGLNPHAGEAGLFGAEESKIIAPAVARAREHGMDVKGPLPPDTVFYSALNQQFDAVVCMYHDQGLIPFKLIHFRDGVNTTLGLPIIRTSVDHGTAYDIVHQGIADHSSLMAAIDMAAFQAANIESQT